MWATRPRLLLEQAEKTAETMVGGWLDTGDTYRQDDDGYYIYEGRSDDMLKAGASGARRSIEICLIAHPAVLEAPWSAATPWPASHLRRAQARHDGVKLTDVDGAPRDAGALWAPAPCGLRRSCRRRRREDPAVHVEDLTGYTGPSTSRRRRGLSA